MVCLYKPEIYPKRAVSNKNIIDSLYVEYFPR